MYPTVASRLRPAAALLVLGIGLGACSSKQPADLLIYNAKVITVDPQFSIHSAIAIRDGRILEVGSDDLVRRYRPRRELDLNGRTVLPGFVDSHTHIDGEPRRHVPLEEVPSLVELATRVSAKAEEFGPDQWITGYGWSEDEIAEGRRPLRADLDLAAPNNPVILTRAGGHSAVVNSLALELAGIHRNTPNPEGGTIERDETGEPNGIIRERQAIVGRLVPDPDVAELEGSLAGKLHDQLRLGITSLIQASASIDDYRMWERVYARERGLPRAAVQILWAGPEAMAALGGVTGAGDQRLRLGAVKIFVDGGFTGPAAYTREPYKGQPNYRGKLNLSVEELRRTIREADGAGWQLGIHAIGDAAIELTVDELAAALAERPRANHRHYLNHFTMMPPPRTMELMAANAIHITQQPNFTYTLEGRYVEHLDGERLEHNNPLRTPMDHGIHVALSSDILPIGPMVGLYAAVTRKGRSGRVFGEGERLTIEEAIRAYTIGGAYLTFEENDKGSIEAGKLADLIVLSEDPLTIDPERLLGIEVDMTIVGGRVEYQRDSESGGIHFRP